MTNTAPDAAAISAHMVNLLGDATFCAALRDLGYTGRALFEAIIDVATGLAARGVPA